MNGRIYRVRHQTAYEYASDVLHAHHLLHLVPRPMSWQRCLEHAIDVEPGEDRRTEFVDAFGNPVTRVEFTQPHRRLAVISQLRVELQARPAVAVEETLAWEQVRDGFAYRGRPPGHDVIEAARFRHESPHVRLKRQFADWSEGCFAAGRPILAAVSALTAQLHADIDYAPGATAVGTPVTAVLEQRRGVCQDYAHLMIACLRSRGLPARYVSGYLRTDAGALVGATATHAWVAAWCPPCGWVELDPTNGCLAGNDHLALAWGRDFSDVSPLRGVILGGAEHRLAVDVVVAPEPAGGPDAQRTA